MLRQLARLGAVCAESLGDTVPGLSPAWPRPAELTVAVLLSLIIDSHVFSLISLLKYFPHAPAFPYGQSDLSKSKSLYLSPVSNPFIGSHCS